MVKALFALLSALALSGCLLNGAREVRGAVARVPENRALIIFSVSVDEVAPDQTAIGLQLDEFSLETGNITGDCYRHNRLVLEAPAAAGEAVFGVFLAPPGDYVLSPFRTGRVDPSALAALHAPAGQTTYLGHFRYVDAAAPPTAAVNEAPQRRLMRTVDLEAAAGFAAERGLPAPQAAQTTPIESLGYIFVCTP